LVGWLVGLLPDWLGNSLAVGFSSNIVIFYSFIITEMCKSCAVCVGILSYVTHITLKL